jgi:response regulator NasT
MPITGLSILIIDENRIRASIIEEGLREASAGRVTVITEMGDLARRVEEIAPDVIVIDLANPNRDMIEHLSSASRPGIRPVAMFVDNADTGLMESAISAGVSAYVVDGLRKEGVKTILDSAILRFNAYSKLRGELDSTRQQLEDRKAVDRAKALLIRMRGLSEEDAYHLIRKTAMRESKRMGEVARTIISTAELLTGNSG